MEFIDLGAQYARLEYDIANRIQAVLKHGSYIMGPEVAELEEALARYVGTRYAISCANGTDALQLALMALKIGPGDAVFTSPFTFFATAEVISLVGAVPVFVDIDPHTYNISTDKLVAAISRVSAAGELKPAAIMPVDLFGLPAEYDAINSIAKRYGLPIIEDAAQGFGGTLRGKRAGSFGTVGATSFFPAKPLGCYGDGGALFTDDDNLYERLRSLRVHGKGADKYDNVQIGLNSRLDTLQAAILLEKLRIFPEELIARQKVADQYTEKLSGILETPVVPSDYSSSWAQYTVRVAPDSRAEMQARLKSEGIPTAIYYAKPLHLQPAFADLGQREGTFPEAEAASHSVLSLPMHPYLTDIEVETVSNAVRKSVEAGTCVS